MSHLAVADGKMLLLSPYVLFLGGIGGGGGEEGIAGAGEEEGGHGGNGFEATQVRSLIRQITGSC